MNVRICDLHCDTLYEASKNKDSTLDRQGHLSIEKLSKYQSYIQVMAMWSDKRLTPDEAFDAFIEGSIILDRDLFLSARRGLSVKKVTCGEHIVKNEKNGISSIVFAVEGGSLLGTDLSRVKQLWLADARLLTLVWSGVNAIGGAHDTNQGLTEFGKAVVNECFNVGIIPDVSHASDKMIADVLEIAIKRGKPIAATHSNSRAVYSHTRNLTDEFYMEIAKLGGVVGISMAPQHLCEKDADISSVIKHIEHYVSLDPKAVCLGCDFDGVETLPSGISGVKDLLSLKEAIESTPSVSEYTDQIMYTNARNFLVNNL